LMNSPTKFSVFVYCRAFLAHRRGPQVSSSFSSFLRPRRRAKNALHNSLRRVRKGFLSGSHFFSTVYEQPSDDCHPLKYPIVGTFVGTLLQSSAHRWAPASNLASVSCRC
jgi:hypothetical protein